MEENEVLQVTATVMQIDCYVVSSILEINREDR